MTHIKKITDIFRSLGVTAALDVAGGVVVSCPCDGAIAAHLKRETPQSLEEKVAAAKKAQGAWAKLPRAARAAHIEAYAASLKKNREALAALVTLEGGKTVKEAQGEVDGAADILLKTIKDAALPELNGMSRVKERPPVGVVGLITSFNFPVAVAHWTLGPALLAANGVVWKPSEKTPLIALACKAVFDAAMGEHGGLLQVLVCARDIGGLMVAHEDVGMISATGSVGMGQAIEAALARKKNNAVLPILELGGNNGVIISDRLSPAQLEWSLNALMNSYLGTAGQRCTDTRRLIVHKSMYDKVADTLRGKVEAFVASGAIVSPLSGASNDYGYGPLIDEAAFRQFEHAKKEAAAEGGKILFGARLLQKEFPDAYYVEPALALMPKQTKLMHEETFGPILFIAPYGDFSEALTLLNAPANAGLVGGLYTGSAAEAEMFARECEAGHVLINAPKGTGTPAHGMGFGGNKDSGCGEILNSADPLAAFTRPGKFTRIATNAAVALDQ